MAKDTMKVASKEHSKAINTKARIVSRKIITDEYNNADFIIYELEREKNNGEIVRMYKAISFLRLIHVAKESKENKKFMEIHTDIYRSMCMANIDTVEVIANIMQPEPIGIVLMYGVQGVGATLEEAKRICEQNFSAFRSAFEGTHRQCFTTPVPLNILRKIFTMMENQRYVTCVKGIPSTKHSSGNNRNPLSMDTNTEEQLEQFLAGLSEVEYCMMLSVSPMSKKYIRSWLNRTLDRWTMWEKQKQGNFNVGLSIGVPLSLSQGVSQGTSQGVNTSHGTSANQNHSHGTNSGTSQNSSHGTSTNQGWSEGTNEGWNAGTNKSDNTGWNKGSSEGHGTSDGRSFSGGFNKIINVSGSWNTGTNTNYGTSEGESGGHSEGTSEGFSGGQSHGVSGGSGTNDSESIGSSQGVSDSDSWGSGTSDSTGSSLGKNVGTSQNMSIGANVGFNLSKGYQWHDMKVEYICELLNRQCSRLKQMDNGDGGAFVDLYISTGTQVDQKAVCGAVGTAWNNANAQLDMLRCEIPSYAEQIKLQQYMLSFSPCQEKVFDPKDKDTYYYKFSSILATNEYVSYNHPPRITLSGFDNAMNDVPEFYIPTNRQTGEIYIGQVMQPTKFSYEQARKYNGNGFCSDFKYCITNSEMMHAFIAAGSRSGKSVLAQRMVSEMYNKALWTDRYGNKKHRRVLIFDPKGDWRALASLVPEGKFKFYSIGRIGFHNLHLNLMRVPKAVNPVIYVNNLIEMFCNAQGLLQKGKNEFRDVVLGLYKEAHVLDNPSDPLWAWEKSKDLTMTDLYDEIMRRKAEAENKRNTGKNTMDAWEAYENRLKMFGDPMYTEYQVFCNKGGDSLEMLLGDDNLTIIESAGLETRTQEFFFTLAMTTIYEYALQFGPKGFYKSEVETVIVIEEANSIIAEKKGEFGNGDAIAQFNTILDKSAGLGLFFWIITQKIHEMPKSCIANSGLTFIGRNQDDEDKKLILSVMGYDERIDVKYKNFLPRMPIGCFIARTARTNDFISQTPVLVQVAMLNTTTPENEELDAIIRHHELFLQEEENRKILEDF
jgi:hypothetical protein